MAEVSFGAGATPVTEEPTPQTEQTNTSTAVDRPAVPDFIPSFKDIILPSVNTSHPVGDLGRQFTNHGSLIFDQRIVLYRPTLFDPSTQAVKEAGTKPFGVTFFAFENPVFVEKVKFGQRGLTLKTEAAVEAAGGTLDYATWELKQASGLKYFQPKSRAMVAIERPEHLPDDGTVFVHEVNGKKFTLGFWSFKGADYTAALKKVIFPAKISGCLLKGYPTFSFLASSKLQRYQTGTQSWVPSLVPNAPSTPEMLAFVKQVLLG